MTPEETKQMFLDALSPLADALASIQMENSSTNSALKQEIATLSSASKSQQSALDSVAEIVGELRQSSATKTYASDIETRLIQLQKAVRTNVDSIITLTDLVQQLQGGDDEAPAPTPETPTEPTNPPVEAPSLLGTTAKINAFTDPTYWNKGVYRQKPGFSIPYSETNVKAFVKGCKVELADGQVRLVNYAQIVGNNMSIFVDGPVLDPSSVGSPNSIVCTDKAIKEIALPIEAPVVVIPTPTPIEPVDPADISGRMCINLGLGMGAEHIVPGRHFSEYRYPQLDEWKKVADDGFECARVGFLWERLIRGGVGGTLSQADIDLMHKSADFAKQVGMTIMWDMHNYSGYGFGTIANNSLRDKIGTARVPTNALGDDWHRIAEALMLDPVCREVTEGFDIMNEPIISWAAWKPALQHCVNAVADAAPDKYVGCEGIAYSSTKNWVKNNPGMETITHPNGNDKLVFHGHYYLDLGSDGFWTTADEKADKIDPMTGVNGIQSFYNWGQTHNKRLAIGETMVPGIYPNSVKALDNFLGFCMTHGVDVFPFFSAYGAGSNWHNVYKPENAASLAVIRKYSLAGK